MLLYFFFFFQAEDGIRDLYVTGVQTCALPISQPVVSRRYLFLCSPPKMVLAIRPDSRATLRKETPRSLGGATAAVGGEAAPWERNAGIHVFGSVRASTFSSGSTIAERLSDWRNARRVEDKRTDTFPCEPRARIRRFLL